MLIPIDHSSSARALELLREGFPQESDAFWRTGLARLLELGWNATAEIPAGHLLMDRDQAVGVILTPATVRRDTNGRLRRIVNLSSWYIRPDHRWRAVAMLRQVLSTSDAIYTDLTPSSDVVRLIRPLGFVPLNQGLVIDALPLTTFARSPGGVVVDLDHVPADRLAPGEHALLAAHRKIGCLPAALLDDEGCCALLFKRCAVKRLPAATLVYCGDNRRLARHLGAVSRFLLRRGRLALVRDARDGDPQPRTSRRLPIGLKFARYTAADAWFFRNRTDFAGSELCILDL